MRYDYDKDSLQSVFKSVLEEFFGPSDQEDADTYDVGNTSVEAGSVVPTYATGDDPISVQLATDTPVITVERAALSWVGLSAIVNTTPQLIVGYHRNRRSVTIVNISPNPIAIGADPNVKYVAPPGFGSAILPANSSVTLKTKAEVWAIASAGSTGEGISIYHVYDEGT